MRRLLGSVLAVLALAACGGGTGDSTPPAGAPAGTVDAPATADAALDFTATTIDGGQIEGSSLEGRDVVLWFWAPW